MRTAKSKSLKNKQAIAVSLITLVLIGAGAWYVAHYDKTTTPALAPIVENFRPDPRTKTSNCKLAIGLPDHACTPGAIFADATKDKICQSGYSQTVRNVPTSIKNQVYAEYGVKMHTIGEYEVDHFISLELGGSNDIANLWPEAASPTPGFHEKDRVENYLHSEVCKGRITLPEAQKEISSDWLRVYEAAKK